MPVQWVNLGLDTLERDAEELLVHVVLDPTAQEVETRMKHNIRERFYDTGATHDSVDVEAPDRLTRDIGPHTDYAIFGELGYLQTTAWGRALAKPIYHPGLHFAWDALKGAKGLLVARLKRAMGMLGK